MTKKTPAEKKHILYIIIQIHHNVALLLFKLDCNFDYESQFFVKCFCFFVAPNESQKNINSFFYSTIKKSFFLGKFVDAVSEI